ncbi:MAG: hypothetical protein QXP38_04280 [Nitrososphaerota archaeon]
MPRASTPLHRVFTSLNKDLGKKFKEFAEELKVNGDSLYFKNERG